MTQEKKSFESKELVSKETMVPRQWGGETLKFGNKHSL